MYTIFLPVLALIGWTFVILLMVPGPRIAALRADPSLRAKTAVNTAAFPENCQKITNNLANLLQLPLLFYVGAVFAILFGATGTLMGIAAWVFVGLRIAHSLVHVTANIVPIRFMVFLLSTVALFVFWILIAMAGFNSPLLSGA